MSADLLDAALDYAGRGRPVLPCWWPVEGDKRCACRSDPQCGTWDAERGKYRGSPGKHPIVGNGLHDASTDPAVVRSWWAKWPQANIGIRTGVAFDVLDIDHEDPQEATAGWPVIDMPGGPVVRTAHGWHFYLRPTGLKNTTGIARTSCDWRGVGGYVIAPPSLHVDGRRYEWFASPDLELQPAPAVLVDVVSGRMSPIGEAVPMGAVPRLSPMGDTRRGWPPVGIFGQMVSAVEGERNATLVWCANKLGLDYHAEKCSRAELDRACEQLHDIAVGRGLTDAETRATIRSGRDKGVIGLRNSDRRSVS